MRFCLLPLIIKHDSIIVVENHTCLFWLKKPCFQKIKAFFVQQDNIIINCLTVLPNTPIQGFVQYRNSGFNSGSLKNIQIIANPLAETISVMRTSMLASMAGVISRNLRQGNANVRLFETGRTYQMTDGNRLETPGLGVMARKGVLDHAWNGTADTMDAFRVKGLLEQIQDRVLGSRPISYHPSEHPAFNPDAVVDLMMGGRKVGILGELSEGTRQRYEIDHEIVAMELDLSVLLADDWRKVTFRPFSQFPRIERDSAFLMDRAVSFADISAFLTGLNEPLLRTVRLFDRYEGKGIPKGKVSLALNFVYQSDDRTLNSEEITGLHDWIVTAFRERFGAELR